MGRIYVAPKLLKWRENIEIDIGNFTFKPPISFEHNSLGFLEAYDNIEDYNRAWPEVEPIVFHIVEAEEE